MLKKLIYLLIVSIPALAACTAASEVATQSFTSRLPTDTATPLPASDQAVTYATGLAVTSEAKVTATSTALTKGEAGCPTGEMYIEGNCLSYEEWLATRPRDMEAYGFEYDPTTKPRLPPSDSLCVPIWPGTTLPLRTIDGEPTFITRPTPETLFSNKENLTMFDCMEATGWDLYCQVQSPLLDYGCESLYKVSSVYANTGPVKSLIARCGYSPPSREEPREDYLYRTGAAFLQDIAYFFFVDGSLRLIKTPAELRELFTPIDSPEQAVNYAQLMTGLIASYQLEPEPEYLYFYDPIDATRVERTDEGYRLFLFHFTRCTCEPWINSEVELLVDRDGTITWVGARPWSMTIGFSCAD